jgi:hypothetical protein
MNRLKANEIVRLFNECNNGSMVAGTVSDFVNSYSFSIPFSSFTFIKGSFFIFSSCILY